MNKSIVIGVTGPSGSGKSTVCKLLSECGFKIIDTDKIGHKVIVQDKSCKEALIFAFGQQILGTDNNINRRKLAEVAFSSPAMTKKLNEITHPYITDEIKKELKFGTVEPCSGTVIDAALLFESMCDRLCDFTLCVVANRDVRKMRVMDRDRIPEEQVKERMAAQNQNEFYAEKSGYVINNSGSLDDLKSETYGFLRKLKELT